MFFSSSPINGFVHSAMHLPLWRSNILLALRAEIKGHLFSASLRFYCLMASHLQCCVEHWIILLSIWAWEYRIKHIEYSFQWWPMVSLMSLAISMMKQVIVSTVKLMQLVYEQGASGAGYYSGKHHKTMSIYFGSNWMLYSFGGLALVKTSQFWGSSWFF